MQPLQGQERYYTALANFMNAASRDQGKMDLQIVDLAVGLHTQSEFVRQALGGILQEMHSAAQLPGEERYYTALSNFMNAASRDQGKKDLQVVDLAVGLHVQSEFLWAVLSNLLEQVRRLRASTVTKKR